MLGAGSAVVAIPAAEPVAGAPCGRLRRVFDAIEFAFDRAFPPACNPWQNLGGLAFLLFWIVAATGVYIYIGFACGVSCRPGDGRAADAACTSETPGKGLR